MLQCLYIKKIGGHVIYNPFLVVKLNQLYVQTAHQLKIESLESNAVKWQCKGIKCESCGTLHNKCQYLSIGGFEISDWCYLAKNYISHMKECPRKGRILYEMKNNILTERE